MHIAFMVSIFIKVLLLAALIVGTWLYFRWIDRAPARALAQAQARALEEDKTVASEEDLEHEEDLKDVELGSSTDGESSEESVRVQESDRSPQSSATEENTEWQQLPFVLKKITGRFFRFDLEYCAFTSPRCFPGLIPLLCHRQIFVTDQKFKSFTTLIICNFHVFDFNDLPIDG